VKKEKKKKKKECTFNLSRCGIIKAVFDDSLEANIFAVGDLLVEETLGEIRRLIGRIRRLVYNRDHRNLMMIAAVYAVHSRLQCVLERLERERINS
jgi:hypothetical protein